MRGRLKNTRALGVERRIGWVDALYRFCPRAAGFGVITHKSVPVFVILMSVGFL